MKSAIKYISILAVFAAFLASCKKDAKGSGTLAFSHDTVFFDTAFTQIGSTTKILMVRNTENNPIVISKVRLGQGQNSKFRMNVDGESGYEIADVEIGAKDSIYIFLEVTIDPYGNNAQLIEEDSVVFETDAGIQSAHLFALGRDANYIYPTNALSGGLKYSILPCNSVWNPGKPYVIIGYAVVDSGCVLTMNPGTQVNFWRNGGLWIYKDATLKVLGERNNKVVFEGSRLGVQYENDPGQWDRIFINEGSTENIIRNAVIKNGFIGLQAEPLDYQSTKPRKIVLENVQITNMTGIGILTRNHHIEANNVLVGNCGNYGVALTFGGDYQFKHCTIANYWSFGTRPNPTLLLGNAIKVYDPSQGEVTLLSDLNASFENSIIYGNIENEVSFDSVAGAAMNFRFENSMIKIDKNYITNTAKYVNIKKNIDPVFTGTYWGDFTLDNTSPAINFGKINVVNTNNSALMFDYFGKNRTADAGPDAGSFER